MLPIARASDDRPDPHAVGMVDMVGAWPQPNFPGYSGQVKTHAPFLPAELKAAGYTTLMSGKWHLGQPGPTACRFHLAGP